MAARRAALAAAGVALVALALALALAPRAEGGQNCICECVKLCMRTQVPGMGQCVGACRENSCVKSCAEACAVKGYTKLPNEGVPGCELEPLTPDETRMLH